VRLVWRQGYFFHAPPSGDEETSPPQSSRATRTECSAAADRLALRRGPRHSMAPRDAQARRWFAIAIGRCRDRGVPTRRGWDAHFATVRTNWDCAGTRCRSHAKAFNLGVSWRRLALAESVELSGGAFVFARCLQRRS